MATRRYIEFRRPPSFWERIGAISEGWHEVFLAPSFWDIEMWEIVAETEIEYLLQRKRTLLRFLRKKMLLPKDYPYILKIFTEGEK